MKIAFFGLPLAALLLSQDGHDIVLASICRRGAMGTRRLRRKLGPERILVKPVVHSADFVERLRSLRPDLIVSWFWTTKLPMDVVGVAPLGGFGVHPSLLPRHRGPDPCFSAIDAGDPLTGVTAHRLGAEYDTGAILGAAAVSIDETWDAWTLAKKLDRPSLALLRDIVRRFARGQPPDERPQDESAATAAPAPTEDELEIDWQWSADRIVRRVRAAAPWPGAFAFLGDRAVTLVKAQLAREFPRALEPGEAAVWPAFGEDGGPYAVIRASEGAVALLAARTEADPDLPRNEGGDEIDLDREDLVELVKRIPQTAGRAIP
jgi:methionyl-tRNA formyltransferase